MEWPNNLQSSTPPRYRFDLVSETETITCNPEPIDWASGTLSMKRDLSVGGVFSTFQQDSLTFIGNGANMLQRLYTAFELNAKCTLIIYWWKNSTRSYIEFPSRFDINFCFYEKVKVGRFFFGVKIKAINSSVQTKLDNRKDIDININNQTSIGGVSIPDYPNLKKILNYPAIDINYNAKLQMGWPINVPSVYYALQHVAHQITYTSIPFSSKQSDFVELNTVEYRTNVPNLNIIPSLFGRALYPHTLKIDYYFIWKITDKYVGSYPWHIQLLRTRAGNPEPIEVIELCGFGGTWGNGGNDGSQTVTLEVGDELKLVVYSPGIDAHYMAYLTRYWIAFTESVQTSPASITEGLPVYEALERLGQNILDTQYPIYSDFFGRQDVKFNDGQFYASENQLRFAHIQSGLNQRGLSINDSETPLALNFKKLFESLRAIYNIGYSLESINGQVRIRIEEYAHFFEDYEVLDLSGRLTKYDIQSQVMIELVPVELKCGFDSFEYLSINGRSEPNTSIQRTSIMNTATKWENISPYRADTKGIFDNISKPISIDAGSSDTKGDSSIFIVKTQRDENAWKPETDELITVDNNSSVFKDSQLNRLFTPSRMLKRHGNRLRAGMSKYLTSYLMFQKSDKSSILETTGKAGSGEEEYSIKENDDILVSSLSAPLFKAIKHTVTVEFSFNDLEQLTAHPYGYITLSDSIAGYLINFKKKNNEDKAEITVIEKYV